MESLSFEDKIAGNTVKLGPGDHQAADEIFISQVKDGIFRTVATLK